MWDYVKNSNVQLTLDLNPFQWRIYVMYAGESVLDPARRMLSIKILCLRLNVIIDDGSTGEIE